MTTKKQKAARKKWNPFAPKRFTRPHLHQATPPADSWWTRPQCADRATFADQLSQELARIRTYGIPYASKELE